AAIGNALAAGAITLSGYDMALGASVTGSGALTLKPSTASRNITIGADNASDFALNPLEISYLTDGFSSITIGRTTDGTGTVTINPVTFNDPTTIAGGSISLGQLSSRSFNGSTDYIDVGTPASLDITGSLTVAGWVRSTDVTIDDQQILSKGFDGANTQYELKIGATNGIVQFNTWNGSLHGVTANTALSSNTWYHIAGTFDGSTWKLYVNGTLDASVNDSQGPFQTAQKVLIGAVDVVGSAIQKWSGLLQNVSVYNRALTLSEIAQIKEAPGSVTSGLKLYAPLSGASPESDYSGNGNVGTLVGTSTSASAPPVTILYAGANPVTLTARTGSIQGSGAGTDITAAALTASAVTGIGSTTQLVTSNVTSGSAATSGGGAAAVNIANSSAS